MSGDAGAKEGRQWESAQVLKIMLENDDYLGFVGINPASTTLAKVRERVAEEAMQGVPGKYVFLLHDGVPVSRRQEHLQLAGNLLPTVVIRPMGAISTKSCRVLLRCNGEDYRTWIPPGYTFRQLRLDAARYWKLPANNIVLEDGGGCGWPDQAEISTMVTLPYSSGEAFVVHVSVNSSMGAHSTGWSGRSRTRSPSRGGRADVAAAAAAAAGEAVVEFQPAASAVPLGEGFSHQYRSSDARQYRGGDSTAALSAAAVPPDSFAEASGGMLTQADVENTLWNIFSFYCVHGDAKEVQHLRCHHWLQLMRDIGLLSPTYQNSTATALFRVIYTSETRGQVGSSGKMNYDEFLNALMNVAARACAPQNHHQLSSPTLLAGTDPRDLDASFADLVATHILPNAKRWKTSEWHALTRCIRQPSVLEVMRPFVAPLFDIFRFYAPDPRDHEDGTITELALYLDYTGFMKVTQDFGLRSSFSLSLQHLGELYLASCASQDGALLRLLGGHPRERRLSMRAARGKTASSLRTVVTPSMARPASSLSLGSKRRVYSDRDRMHFEGFLDVLLRASIAGLSGYFAASHRGASNTASSPYLAAKALFQSLSRHLIRSRVTKIMAKRRSTCAAPAGLMSGTMSLNAKYLAMWKLDGCVDYLADDLLVRSDAAAAGLRPSKASPESSGAQHQRADARLGSVLSAASSASLPSPSPDATHRKPAAATTPVHLTKAERKPPQSGRSLLARLLQGSETDTPEKKLLRGKGARAARDVGPSTGEADVAYLPQRERTPSGSVTPRVLTPRVMGGSGETRSPSFRAKLLIDGHGTKLGPIKSQNTASPFNFRKLAFGGSSKRAADHSRAAAVGVRREGTTAGARTSSPLVPSQQASQRASQQASQRAQAVDRAHAKLGNEKQDASPLQVSIPENQLARQAIRVEPESLPAAPHAAAAQDPGLASNSSKVAAKTGGAASSANPKQSRGDTEQGDRHRDGSKAARVGTSTPAQEDKRQPSRDTSSKLEAISELTEDRKKKKKEKAIVRTLTKGHLFFKYSRKGTKSRRFVYVTANLREIQWKAVGSAEGEPAKKTFAVRNLTGVKEGGKWASQSTGITLNLDSRDIELECDSSKQRDAFVAAFRWLIQSQEL